MLDHFFVFTVTRAWQTFYVTTNFKHIKRLLLFSFRCIKRVEAITGYGVFVVVVVLYFNLNAHTMSKNERFLVGVCAPLFHFLDKNELNGKYYSSMVQRHRTLSINA